MADGGDSQAKRFYFVAPVLHVALGDHNISLLAIVSALQFIKQSSHFFWERSGSVAES